MQHLKPTDDEAQTKPAARRRPTTNHARYILMAIVMSGGGLLVQFDVELPNGQHLGIGSKIERRARVSGYLSVPGRD